MTQATEIGNPTTITVECASCHAPVRLKCEGLHGVAGYPIYSQFDCPHCRKLNSVKTPGHILNVEPT